MTALKPYTLRIVMYVLKTRWETKTFSIIVNISVFIEYHRVGICSGAKSRGARILGGHLDGFPINEKNIVYDIHVYVTYSF